MRQKSLASVSFLQLGYHVLCKSMKSCTPMDRLCSRPNCVGRKRYAMNFDIFDYTAILMTSTRRTMRKGAPLFFIHGDSDVLISLQERCGDPIRRGDLVTTSCDSSELRFQYSKNAHYFLNTAVLLVSLSCWLSRNAIPPARSEFYSRSATLCI